MLSLHSSFFFWNAACIVCYAGQELLLLFFFLTQSHTFPLLLFYLSLHMVLPVKNITTLMDTNLLIETPDVDDKTVLGIIIAKLNSILFKKIH